MEISLKIYLNCKSSLRWRRAELCWQVMVRSNDGRTATKDVRITITELDVPQIRLALDNPRPKFPVTDEARRVADRGVCRALASFSSRFRAVLGVFQGFSSVFVWFWWQISISGTVESELDPTVNLVFSWKAGSSLLDMAFEAVSGGFCCVFRGFGPDFQPFRLVLEQKVLVFSTNGDYDGDLAREMENDGDPNTVYRVDKPLGSCFESNLDRDTWYRCALRVGVQQLLVAISPLYMQYIVYDSLNV